MRDTTYACEPALFGDSQDLADLRADQFTLSDAAIQAVLDGEGPGLSETDIALLTAIAVATGAVREVGGEQRRVRSFLVRDGVFTPVPPEPAVVVAPLMIHEPPVGKLSGSH